METFVAPKEVVMSRFNDNEFVPDDDVDDYDDLDDYDELSDDDYGDYDDDDYDDDLEDASEDEIDFVVALYNADGERVAVPMEPMLANDFDELITQLRRLPGDAGAVGMVSIDHQFYVIVRVRGRNVQVFLSDATQANDWPIARDVADFPVRTFLIPMTIPRPWVTATCLLMLGWGSLTWRLSLTLTRTLTRSCPILLPGFTSGRSSSGPLTLRRADLWPVRCRVGVRP